MLFSRKPTTKTEIFRWVMLAAVAGIPEKRVAVIG